jgi:acyl carrier protein
MSATNDRLAVRDRIRELLGRKGDHHGFADQDSLIVSGRLDSVDVIDLVVFLEKTYSVDFSDRFDQEDLDSVDVIMELVGRH